MITDPAALASFREQWSAISTLQKASHRQWHAGPVFINETPHEKSFNLPFVLAYGVLDQILSELINQGVVPDPGGKFPGLGKKMKSSQTAILWQNYTEVELGKSERNKIAHSGALFDRATCIRFIGAIEAELKAWGIL